MLTGPLWLPGLLETQGHLRSHTLHHQLRLREQIAISSELKWTDCHDHSIYPSC